MSRVVEDHLGIGIVALEGFRPRRQEERIVFPHTARVGRRGVDVSGSCRTRRVRSPVQIATAWSERYADDLRSLCECAIISNRIDGFRAKIAE
jgi:hypothetical protein